MKVGAMRGGDGAALLWRVEEACANAYPCWRELHSDGWLLRAAGGPTRRINSVNPLHAGVGDPGAILADAQRIYHRLGQSVVFRVPDLVPGLDGSLDRLGLVREGACRTLLADPVAADHVGDVTLAASPHPGWFDAWKTLRSDHTPAAAASIGRVLDGLLVPSAFACRQVDGTPMAVAYAALHRGIAVIESVVTHAAHRQRGHGGAVVRRLQTWAAQAGAEAVCLQVAADNHPARALYAATGFTRDLYGYHYRRAPPPRDTGAWHGAARPL